MVPSLQHGHNSLYYTLMLGIWSSRPISILPIFPSSESERRVAITHFLPACNHQRTSRHPPRPQPAPSLPESRGWRLYSPFVCRSAKRDTLACVHSSRPIVLIEVSFKQRLKSPARPWPLDAVMLRHLHGPIQTPLSFAERRH